ncbi:MAG TPA: hypothetical protein DHW65_04030 [Dehalococcoidia bacterium]|nr:hypothetical protein [Chloroflexota bacterium]HCL25500.1 hypothetical protein [Dehalococcoidia bacterium]
MFAVSILVSPQLKQDWANVQNAPNLTNAQEWKIAREVLWYLLFQCDQILRFEFRVQNTNEVMSQITKRALAKFLASAFDFSSTSKDLREVQRRDLSVWQLEAEHEYKQPVQAIPVEQHGELIRTGRLVPGGPLDRLCRRVEKAIGSPLTNTDSQAFDDAEPSPSVYERIAKEGVSLEDILVTKVGAIGDSIGDMLMEEEFWNTYYKKPSDQEARR